MTPHDLSDLATFLRGLAVFDGMSDVRLSAIAQACHVRRLPKGKALFNQEDPADTAFIVRTGCVSLILSTPDGRDLVINDMLPGDMFGELSLVTGQPRSTGAVAREPSEVISIPREEFMAELEAEPKLMRRVLETTSRRLRRSSERESALAFLDAPARIARVLLRRSEQQRDNPDVVTVSQEEIAQHVGVTRQTVARVLGKWRRRGWIITGRGKIMLVNRGALRRQGEEMPH